MREKYFYISVPEESFHEVKYTFYEAPSSYLRVFNSDIVQEQQERIEQLENALEGVLESADFPEHVAQIAIKALGKEE